MIRNIFSFSLILLAAFSRLLPHPPNVVPIAALALFGGVYLDRKHTFVVPLAAMFVADFFLGFHSAIAWVYAGFILIGFIGLWLRSHAGVLQTLGASIVGSIVFFIVTNFGVWTSWHGLYTPDATGLVQCYVAALPFLRNQMMGDLFYVGVLFGLYELAKKYVPNLMLGSEKTCA